MSRDIEIKNKTHDSDGDGIPDASGNCVDVENAGQLDSDDCGNACDFDQILTCRRGASGFTAFVAKRLPRSFLRKPTGRGN